MTLQETGQTVPLSTALAEPKAVDDLSADAAGPKGEEGQGHDSQKLGTQEKAYKVVPIELEETTPSSITAVAQAVRYSIAPAAGPKREVHGHDSQHHETQKEDNTASASRSPKDNVPAPTQGHKITGIEPQDSQQNTESRDGASIETAEVSKDPTPPLESVENAVSASAQGHENTEVEPDGGQTSTEPDEYYPQNLDVRRTAYSVPRELS